MSKVTFFQAKLSNCLSSSSVLGAGSLYVVSCTIIQMVSRGFTSREFAGQSSFGIKLANPSDTMLAWSVHRLFLFKAFQLFLVTYPHSVVLETLIDNVKLEFFNFLFCGNITHILTAFSTIFLKHFVKKRPSILGLSSKVFDFDHLFGHRSDVFNNLAISFFYTDWPEDHKNRCLSSSITVYWSSFSWRSIEKMKEND